MTISATNTAGTTDYTCTFTRDDTEPVYTLSGDWRELSIYQIMVDALHLKPESETECDFRLRDGVNTPYTELEEGEQ